MDLTKTTAPKSDQQNFDDYVAGPKTVTVSGVKPGSEEQPAEIHLVEFPGRPFKPSKSMRRVLVAAWGSETDVYTGRRMTLVGDPTVKFGGQVVGGVRISHLSHITKPLTMALTVTKGKRNPFTVQPLPDAPAPVASQPKSDRLMDALKANGLAEKGPALAFISQTIGRDVQATKELTADEVDLVVHELTEAPGGDK